MLGTQAHGTTSDRRRLPRTLVVTAVAVLTGLVAAALAVAWALGSANDVQARSVVLLTPLHGNPYAATGTSDDVVDLRTEAQLVVSDAVGREVARRLDDDRPVVDVLAGVTVEVPDNTQLLEITAPGADEATARQAAAELAETYLDYRRTVAESAVFDRTAALEEEVAALERDELQIATELAAPATGAVRAAQLAELSRANGARLADLRAGLGELRATPLDPGRVVTPATDEPGIPGGVLLAGVLAFLVGAGLALAAVALTRRLTDVVQTPSDLARADTPVLGVLPALPAGHPSTTWLRASVLSLHPERPTVVMVVDAATPAPARGYDVRADVDDLGGGLAGTLAVQCAASRLRTIVVDVTGAGGPRPGLTQALTDPASVDAVVTEASEHLRVLGAGDDHAALDDLAASPEMTDLVQRLRQTHPVVVLSAGGPWDARTQALAGAADVVLLSVSPGAIRLDELDEASATLAQLGAGVVRSVLVLPGDRGRLIELPPVVSV